MKLPRIVKVSWVDSASEDSWKPLSEIDTDECNIESIGYLIYQDKKQVILAATVKLDDPITHSGQRFWIPRGCIKKIKTLK